MVLSPSQLNHNGKSKLGPVVCIPAFFSLKKKAFISRNSYLLQGQDAASFDVFRSEREGEKRELSDSAQCLACDRLFVIFGKKSSKSFSRSSDGLTELLRIL